MKTKHTIIYITGLGDAKPVRQQQAIKLWKLYGVESELFHNHWADKKPFSEKLERLLSRIDFLVQNGHAVSLVGVSAGASVALTAFALRKEDISGVVCLCGKINRAETVSEAYYDKNPAFRTSMYQLSDKISMFNGKDKNKILSIHPLFDQTVPVSDTKIAGVRSKLIPTALHVPSIALGITLFSWTIVSFLKKGLQ